MHNKSHINCQIFIKILEGKRLASRLLEAVALMKCHQRIFFLMAELCSSVTLLNLATDQQIVFRF